MNEITLQTVVLFSQKRKKKQNKTKQKQKRKTNKAQGNKQANFWFTFFNIFFICVFQMTRRGKASGMLYHRVCRPANSSAA
jgi:hypothetical protein